MATNFRLINMSKAELKTDSQIRKAIGDTTCTTAYRIMGYTGLEINIRVSDKGKKVADFRHRYTHPITGKRPYLTLGTYPAFTLEQARKAYNDNLALLAKDIDPKEFRDNRKLEERLNRENTLQYFIDKWWQLQLDKKLSPVTYPKIKRNIKPIEKELGKMLVTDIKPSHVISFINNIKETYPSKGVRVKGVLHSILQIAKVHKVIEYNPASDLKGALITYKGKHQPALTNPSEFAKLLIEIDNLPAHTDSFPKEILQLLALTFARIGDICSMKWADIDLINKQWAFRPQKAGRRDDMTDLVIPLSAQVVSILEGMKAKTGEYDYVFYNPKRKHQKYTHQQEINKVLNSEMMNEGKSYKGIHSPHGFRASAKTMLMERLGYDELITELQLGHRMVNRYGKAYARMDMLEQRRVMMNDWADYINKLSNT